MPMPYTISAYVGDYPLSLDAETAKEAFAKAVEWQVVGGLTDIVISNGINCYSIAEFSTVVEDADRS